MPRVDGLKWDPRTGAFGNDGPQGYWCLLVRWMYDAQRVRNVRELAARMRAAPPERLNNSTTAWRRYRQAVVDRLNERDRGMDENLGVTAYGYVANVEDERLPWRKSYTRFGRAWGLRDEDPTNKHQLPFGAYTDAMYNPFTPQVRPRDDLERVVTRALCMHVLVNHGVYGHIQTNGIASHWRPCSARCDAPWASTRNPCSGSRCLRAGGWPPPLVPLLPQC